MLRKNRSGYQTFREKGKTKLVHRRVAEKKLGGKIWKGFEVHHKDGNKSNNRASNLTVVSKKKHRRLHKK